MKLKVVSPVQAHAEAWAAVLSHADLGGQHVECIVRPLTAVNVLVNGSRPDLVVVETTSPQDFDALEKLAQQHPEIEYVLVGSNLSPDVLMRAMRAGVREVLPAPVQAADVLQAVQRQARKRAPQPAAIAPMAYAEPARQGKVVAFISCKGGSGATFAAANLAHVLAADGKRKVALIDLNLQFGDALFFVSSDKPGSNVADMARNIGRLDRAMLDSAMLQVSPGMQVLAAPEDPAQSTDVSPAHVATLIDLARTMFDFVVVDLGRALTGVTLQALDQADHVLAVLQLTLPYIRDGRRLRDVFRSLDYPASKIHWLVNRYEKKSQITLDDLRRTLGVDALLTLPNQYDVVASAVNQGLPVAKIAPNSPITKALRELAETLDPATSDRPRASGWFGQLLRNGNERGAAR